MQVVRSAPCIPSAAGAVQALERRYQGHMHADPLARRPESRSARRSAGWPERARSEPAESALFGSPDEIMRKLEVLRTAAWNSSSSTLAAQNVAACARDHAGVRDEPLCLPGRVRIWEQQQ